MEVEFPPVLNAKFPLRLEEAKTGVLGAIEIGVGVVGMSSLRGFEGSPAWEGSDVWEGDPMVV